MIVIAHRLTTVEKCDPVYWINDGTIKMKGKPEDILPVYTSYLENLANTILENEIHTKTFSAL